MSAGGRCSSITALGANLLNIKPCIEVDNTTGGMHVGKKYRGALDKVLPHYVRDTLRAYEGLNTSRIFITHSGIDESYIRLVKEAVEQEASFEKIYITQAAVRFPATAGRIRWESCLRRRARKGPADRRGCCPCLLKTAG